MDEYIEREALREAFENSDADVVEEYEDGACDWGFGRKNILEVINSVPAADVAPVRHGKWELSKNYVGYCSCSMCSDCYVEQEWVDRLHWRFCPSCGAMMDGAHDG